MLETVRKNVAVVLCALVLASCNNALEVEPSVSNEPVVTMPSIEPLSEPSTEPSVEPEHVYDPFNNAPYEDYEPNVAPEGVMVDDIYRLAPREIGEFVDDFDYDTGHGVIYSPDGFYFGDEDDFTPGCGVGCVIGCDNIISASSTLDGDGEHSYSADNAFNIRRDNAWVEGADGYGVGETLTIRQMCAPFAYWNLVDTQYNDSLEAIFDDTSRVLPPSYLEDSYYYNSVCIVSGYAENDKLWARNSRVKTLNMYFNGEIYGVLQLDDTIKPQFFDLYDIAPHFGEVVEFVFEIDDIYQGEIDDTCITGIEFGIVGQSGAH